MVMVIDGDSVAHSQLYKKRGRHGHCATRGNFRGLRSGCQIFVRPAEPHTALRMVGKDTLHRSHSIIKKNFVLRSHLCIGTKTLYARLGVKAR